MNFPSDRVRKTTLYWSVIFLTLLISCLTVFGDASNTLHQTSLEGGLELYTWLVIAVVADTVGSAAVSSWVDRRTQNNT